MADPDVYLSQATFDQLLASAQSDGIQKMVVVAVILLQGNVLVFQRRSGDFMDGLIELPSGNVKRDETLTQTVVREVFEETG